MLRITSRLSSATAGRAAVVASAAKAAMVASAGAVLLAACGEGPSPRERLEAAPEATSAAGSAAFSMTAEIQSGSEGMGMHVTISGDGAMDMESGAGHMTMNLGGLGGSLDLVFRGDTVYLRLPPAFTGGQEQWIRQEPGEDAVEMGPGVGNDPTRMIAALDSVEGEISSLGSDVVREVDVQGYGFTVGGAGLFGGAEDLPPGATDIRVPMEVWLDQDGRVRRLTASIDLQALADAARQGDDSLSAEDRQALDMMTAMGGTLDLTLELFDFGTPVEVELPDPESVMDAEAFQQRTQEEAGGR